MSRKENFNNEENRTFIVSVLEKVVHSVSNQKDKEKLKKRRNWSKKAFCQCPAAYGMISITILEITIMLYYYLYSNKNLNTMQQMITEGYLIFDPNKKKQVWRLFTQLFVHFRY